jgi:hypothetical protein
MEIERASVVDAGHALSGIVQYIGYLWRSTIDRDEP